jgi:hypothetical protein
MAAPPTAVMPFPVVVAKRGILPAAETFTPPIVGYGYVPYAVGRDISSTVHAEVAFAIDSDVSSAINAQVSLPINGQIVSGTNFICIAHATVSDRRSAVVPQVVFADYGVRSGSRRHVSSLSKALVRDVTLPSHLT